MDIRFKIDPDRITWDDLIAMEDAEHMTDRQLIGLMSRVSVDADGNYLAPEDARKALGALTLTQRVEAVQAFYRAIVEVKQAAVPLASGES